MLWLLDTNIASLAIRGHREVLERLAALPMHELKMSAVTQAELLYGVAKRGRPSRLAALVQAFLDRVEPMPWTPEVAVVYADLRAECEARGRPLAALDMMIAAHARQLAVTQPTTLVTRDQAFVRAGLGLPVQTWAEGTS